jgi:hypothetical protein
MFRVFVVASVLVLCIFTSDSESGCGASRRQARRDSRVMSRMAGSCGSASMSYSSMSSSACSTGSCSTSRTVMMQRQFVPMTTQHTVTFTSGPSACKDGSCSIPAAPK